MTAFHDDPLDDLFNSDPNVVAFPRREPPASYQPPSFTEPCRKCRGTGNWRPGYPCFTCKGKGSKSFKTSPEQRAQSAASAANRRARTQEENVADFKAEHPDVFAWMDGSTFPFAISLLEGVRKYGALTENQMAAAHRCIEKLAAARAARIDRQENAPTVNADRLAEAFRHAAASGLRYPKLYIAEFTFAPAGAHSRNPGSIYVTQDKVYLGRVTEGRFFSSSACNDAQRARVVEVAADPHAAAVAHGLLTGNCACCGRLLTNPESVARGIGPICAGRFGW